MTFEDRIEAVEALGFTTRQARFLVLVALHSADTAVRLEALTRMDAAFWLRLQSDWDLWHALRARRRRLQVKPLAASA